MIYWQNLKHEIVDMIKNPTFPTEAIEESDFYSTANSPKTGMFIVSPSVGGTRLPSRDTFAFVSIYNPQVITYDNNGTIEQYKVRVTHAMRMTGLDRSVDGMEWFDYTLYRPTDEGWNSPIAVGKDGKEVYNRIGYTAEWVPVDVKIINNLVEGGEQSALSAEQGKILKDLIDNSPYLEVFETSLNTIYFDSQNGNDATGDGSQSKPYKDIQLFLDGLKNKIINQNLSLTFLGKLDSLDIGDIYGHGTLSIISKNSEALASFNAHDCTVNLMIDSLKSYGFSANRIYGDLLFKQCHTTNSQLGFTLSNINRVNIQESTAENCTYFARADGCPAVFVIGANSVNSDNAFMAIGNSRIKAYGNKAGFPTRTLEFSGGEVVWK